MKYLFVDTNILIDFLTNRKPYSIYAAELFELALQGEIYLYISAISYNNIYYIVKKILGHTETMLLLNKLAKFVIILDVTQKVITDALHSENPDFEDSIQYFSAITNLKMEAIITRDKKGFKNSKLPVYTLEEAIILLS